jgi:hypothetical protein
MIIKIKGKKECCSKTEDIHSQQLSNTKKNGSFVFLCSDINL